MKTKGQEKLKLRKLNHHEYYTTNTAEYRISHWNYEQKNNPGEGDIFLQNSDILELWAQKKIPNENKFTGVFKWFATLIPTETAKFEFEFEWMNSYNCSYKYRGERKEQKLILVWNERTNE